MAHLYDAPDTPHLARDNRQGIKDRTLAGRLAEYDAVNWGRRDFLDEMHAITSSGGVLSKAQAEAADNALAHWQTARLRARPLDINALPPGHDPEVWALAVLWNQAAEYHDRHSPSPRFTYAMLVERIKQSNIRANYRLVPEGKSADGRRIPARPGWEDRQEGPGWQRCVAAMIRYHWEHYAPARDTGTGQALRDFTDRQEWESLRDTVTGRAVNRALGDPREWPRPGPRPVSPEERQRNQQRRRRRG